MKKTVCMLAAMMFAPAASAQFDTGDIAINLDGNRIALGAYAPGVPLGLVEDCVFISDLGPLATSDDPGFDSPTGVFEPGASARFDILGPLMFWENGAMVTAPGALGVAFGPLVENVSDQLTGSESTGAGWASVSTNGELHRHWVFALIDPFQSGVYAIEARIGVSGSTEAASDPFWLILTTGASNGDVVLAEDYIRANLAGCTPANRADMTTTNTNPGDAGYGIADGLVDGADLSFYVERWIATDALRADLTTTNTNPGDALYGVPDDAVDGADLSFFVELWLNSSL